MPEHSHKIILVTPVWNDSTRLALYGADLANAFAASHLPIHWIIADDGSSLWEIEQLKVLRENFAKVFPHVSLHFAAKHRGKGSIVREAWTLSLDAEWLAFVDADGSVTAEDLIKLLETAVATNTSVLGIRKSNEQTRIVYSPFRSLVHHGFLIATRLILNLQCLDPQCGVKILHAAQYRKISPRLMENGYSFDSELLVNLRASGAGWSEIPINWVEKKGGKVKPLKDAWGMLVALVRIRLRSLRSTTTE
ncbi:MAG: glycosyltransferase [Gloeobacteraceae cyanobacterium ES-bin-144]|nr:glycosyltransferase [Verrucomicrobiales bacterium]